jgi:hypothetical protein
VKKLSLVVLIIMLATTAFSQSSREERQQKKEARRQKINELARQAEEGVLIYQKQSLFGLQLKTDGYGGFYEFGKMKTNRKTNIYRLDITETKEHKEEKLFGESFIFGNPYIYGKVNYFYPVTFGFGQQYILGQKGNKNGVAVSVVYNGGISIGLLRPYYVKVNDPNKGERYIKYSSDDSSLFVDQSVILSGGGFGKGWGEIKVKPGVFLKGALRFDYGRFTESVGALEIGASVEAYASKIPVMLYQKDRNFFMQIYVALVFGKRK